MRRRDFITLLGSATAWRLAARAQQPSLPTIGFLGFWASPKGVENLLVAFRQGLRSTGFVEGQNVTVEYRWGNFQFDRLKTLAAELVRHPVSVIVAAGFGPPVGAAKAVTSTIPIVFAYGGDPVRDGFVASLNRPGGNITGVAAINSDLGGKRLSLLRDLVPQATTFGFLCRPNEGQQLLRAAHDLGWELVVLEIRGIGDYEAAFATLVRRQAEALVVSAAPLNDDKIVELATRYKIPTIYPRRGNVAAGGLMSYAPHFEDIYRQAGIYTGRILKGDKPSDLPVMLTDKFEFVINLNTAKALGIEVPPQLFAIADEIIE
jgi:putative ABC transport system substrate-binding protein